MGVQCTSASIALIHLGLVWFLIQSAALSVSAPFVLHAFTVFPDAPGALCVAAAVALLIQLEYRGPANVPLVWVAGAALAALPWLHSRFSLLAISMQ